MYDGTIVEFRDSSKSIDFKEIMNEIFSEKGDFCKRFKCREVEHPSSKEIVVYVSDWVKQAIG